MCLNLLSKFEQISVKKYKSDLETFLRESNFKDFINFGQDEIIVSTVHKAKGREFDNVYMMMNNVNCCNEDEKHKTYVGLTRAKNELYIHYNNNYFDKLNTSKFENIYDNNEYAELNEIVMELFKNDVFLDFFKPRKNKYLD